MLVVMFNQELMQRRCFVTLLVDLSSKSEIQLIISMFESLMGSTTNNELTALQGGGPDWLQSLNKFLINVSYHILVACLTLMALL